MAKFYKLSPNEMRIGFWDCYCDSGLRNVPTHFSTKKEIRDFLVNFAFVYCAEIGRFAEMAEDEGFSDYRYGNIKEAVNLIFEDFQFSLRMTT